MSKSKKKASKPRPSRAKRYSLFIAGERASSFAVSLKDARYIFRPLLAKPDTTLGAVSGSDFPHAPQYKAAIKRLLAA